MLRGPGILAPPAIDREAIFILGGPEHQADSPFSGARVFQRRGIWTPAIETTDHTHFPGFRSENCEVNFLFLQRGEALRHRLNCRWWIDLSGSGLMGLLGFSWGFASFKASSSRTRSRDSVVVTYA